MKNYFIRAIRKPRVAFIVLLHSASFLLPDKLYISLMYRLMMHRRLNLKNPETFNEKLQWLKLYNRKPEYTIMVDKVKAKEYVASKIGEEYIIPTLGVWEDPDDIDFKALPEQFVLKCNHNSGTGMCICRNKSKLDIFKVKAELRKGLKENYFLRCREWPYKNVPRRILAEKYLVNESDPNKALLDYKFLCFDGRADNVMVCVGRETGNPKFYHFDRDWNFLKINRCGLEIPANFHIEKPVQMDKMFEIADKLSVGLPHVRVDLYDINNHIYFGELTFFQDSGFDRDLLYETDRYLGGLIKL